MQGTDPQLPANFDDFIKSVFGVHGLQVLNDLREWTDPSTDLGQKLAGLADQTALDLLKNTTGIDPAADFNKAKQILGNALNTWYSLPDKLSSTPLCCGPLADPTTGADALAQVLQKATFGDTWEGQFLEAIADRGLLELANRLGPVSTYAGKVLDILNGGIIAKHSSIKN